MLVHVISFLNILDITNILNIYKSHEGKYTFLIFT